MEWQVPASDKAILRELAGRQSAYAALPVMEERKRMWYDLNDGVANARPPFVIETWTFDRDFFPENILRCVSEDGRSIERQLLRNVRNHEIIDDDKVIPDAFHVRWFVDIDELGVKVETETIKDSQGIETGYRFIHPIKDIRTDLDILKPVVCSVDRERTLSWKAFVEGLIGDILKVELISDAFGMPFLTCRVVELMGMEAFFMAMYDAPDHLHRLMAYLRDNSLKMTHWAEEEGLLRLNNRNQASCWSSYNFTKALPAPGFDGERVRTRDMWMTANSQETVGVSPEMFHEFCFPYYRDACAPAGLLYFGCCEPVHPIWEDLRQLPHLKKISISKWCDQNFMGEALRGTGVVYSRKPDPNYLSVDERLDEDAWAAHISETLDAARGVPVEFVVRDVYTVHGNLANAANAVKVARREIDKRYKA